MTTADKTSDLDKAIALLAEEAGGDPRAAAILAWARTRERVFLKTIGAVYRNDGDEVIRQLARVANEFVDHDPHTPFYDDGPLQLNMAVSSYRIGDRVKALDYLTRAVQLKPEWHGNPIVADFAAALMGIDSEHAADMIAAPGSQSAFNVAKGAGWWQDRALVTSHVTRRSFVRNLILFGIGITLLAALAIHVAADLWLPQARLVRVGPTVDLIDALIGPARWAFSHLWSVATLIGLLASLDLLARGFVMHLAAILVIEGKERSFLLLFHRLMIWQTVLAVLSLGALCAIFILSALSLSDTRNSTLAVLDLSRAFSQLRIWVIASAVAYCVFVGRLLMETYRFGLFRAGFVLLSSAVVVTAAEALLTSGILSLIRR